MKLKFELTQTDIEEAIINWINSKTSNITNFTNDFFITFDVAHKESWPEGGPRGGMADPIITTIITATATPKE